MLLKKTFIEWVVFCKEMVPLLVNQNNFFFLIFIFFYIALFTMGAFHNGHSKAALREKRKLKTENLKKALQR